MPLESEPYVEQGSRLSGGIPLASPRMGVSLPLRVRPPTPTPEDVCGRGTLRTSGCRRAGAASVVWRGVLRYPSGGHSGEELRSVTLRVGSATRMSPARMCAGRFPRIA